MEKHKEQIEKEAKEYAYAFGNGIFNDGLYSGFISGVNSKISERMRIDFAISVLDELSVAGDIEANIINKITELKKQRDGK